MPRERKQTGKNARADVNANRPYYCASDAAWGGYVNLRVTEDERSDFDGWFIEEEANLSDMLAQAIVDGLKVSVSYDAENSSAIATFTGAGCIGDKARYVLTARNADWWSAIALLLYKHHVLLDADWGRFRPANGTASFG